MSARLYDRPDLDQREGRLALYVTGSLPNAMPSQAYEGRLQITNSVGACTVRQIDGDTLPPGHRLYVDQASRQVVLAWPAFQENAAPIANPGFEDGPTGWEAGAGWVIATENPPVGLWAAGYNNNQGESVISSTSRYAVYAGQRTSAKCKVRQGASAEGNAGASVLLEYRDQDGQVVGRVEGNRVMSASKNRVYDSDVVGTAPAGAATINVAGNGIRYRENKILFVDAFEWDHTVAAAGVNHEVTYAITLLVSDSLGRSARWEGRVVVAVIRDYATEVLLDTPVAYWKLDDALGAVSFADSSGNGISARTIRTWAGAATEPLMQRGPLRTGGQSGWFDGISNIGVEPGDSGFANLAISPGGTFAVECVLETPTFLGNSTPYILRKQAETSTAHYEDYLLGFAGNQTFQLVFGWTNSGAGSARHVTAPFALEPGRIYHVLGVCDVVGGVVTVSLYINGELVAMRDDSSMQQLPIDSAGAFTVNAPQNWGAWSFSGRISDIALYAHPLSAARALAHARAAGLAAL